MSRRAWAPGGSAPGALGQEGAGPEREKGQISGAHSQGQALGTSRAFLPQPSLAPLWAPSAEITEFPSPGQLATPSLLFSKAQRAKGWGDQGPGCTRGLHPPPCSPSARHGARPRGWSHTVARPVGALVSKRSPGVSRVYWGHQLSASEAGSVVVRLAPNPGPDRRE